MLAVRRPCLALLLPLALPACGDPGPDEGPSQYRCLALPRPPSDAIVRLERVLPNITIEGGIDLLQAPGLPERWYLATQSGSFYS